MQKVRLFKNFYQIYFDAVFNVVKTNGIRIGRLFPKIQRNKSPLPRYLTYGLPGLSFPLTVSAGWAPSFRKNTPDPNGLKLRHPEDHELSSALNAADKMYVTGEMSRNDEIYQQLLAHKEKQEPELLWRLARSTYEKSKKITDTKEKQRLVDEAHSIVANSIKLDENIFASHKWMAIILNEKSKLAGLKEQITQSFNVKFHMQRAIELNPKDATSSYLLGQWCFSVSEVPWYQQKIASAIFATPPTSTYEEALFHFLNAESIQPLFYSMNLLMLAKTYMKLGDTVNANVYLDKLANLPQKNEEDFLAMQEGRELRNKISPGFQEKEAPQPSSTTS